MKVYLHTFGCCVFAKIANKLTTNMHVVAASAAVTPSPAAAGIAAGVWDIAGAWTDGSSTYRTAPVSN